VFWLRRNGFQFKDKWQTWAYLRPNLGLPASPRGDLPCRAVPGPGPGVAAAPPRSERLGPAGTGRHRLVL